VRLLRSARFGIRFAAGRFMDYDVTIVGGGPAGLSAALVLARCKRRVVVVDAGNPRNAAARAMHNYLSRDGTPPREMLRMSRDEVMRYGVQILHARATQVHRVKAANRIAECAFETVLEDGRRFVSRKLLLATGVVDLLPEIEEIRSHYGQWVHHCPYCDGYEHADGHLVAYGPGTQGAGLAFALRTWSQQVTACSDGESLDADQRRRLQRNGIAWREEKVVRLEEHEGERRVIFASGPPLVCEAFFFNTGKVQCSDLGLQLGCPQDRLGMMKTGAKQRTDQPGLYIAGDADGDVQFVIIAAAEGATAGVAINRDLQDEDCACREGEAPELQTSTEFRKG
jgi:thioredoxin reductase